MGPHVRVEWRTYPYTLQSSALVLKSAWSRCTVRSGGVRNAHHRPCPDPPSAPAPERAFRVLCPPV